MPRQIYLGTLVQSVGPLAASLVCRQALRPVRRRKVFVIVAAVVYAVAMLFMSPPGTTTGYLVGMAIGGLGFGMYMAVDLALVVDVLPDTANAAKDLGVLNIAGALPFAVAPALAPAILAAGGGSYTVLYAVAGACALASAAAITRVRQVR